MNIKHNNTGLVRAGDVVIPEEFFNRLKTGNAKIDKIFGEGILPGMLFTISADPGCGKTTLMLQICQALCDKGFAAAYVTGEESQEMVAYSCARIQADDVLIACCNNIDSIENMVEQADLLIIDSFQAMHADADMSASKMEQYKSDTLVSLAKKHKTAIGIIMHSTKGGTYKGGSGVVHAVDCNMRLEASSDNVRVIDVSKNRYGSVGCHTFFFGSMGYDFEQQVVQTQSNESGNNKSKQMQQIMNMTEPPNISVQRVCNDLQIDSLRANYLLRLLTNEGKLQKFGRGNDAVWKFTQIEQLQNA